MKKFTERTYGSEKQFNKAYKKLTKKGFKAVKISEEKGRYIVEYQTRA